MPNPIIRWQIVSPEPERVAKFYHQLFGWKVSAANALGYREFKTGAISPSPVDGGVWPAAPGQGPLAQFYVEVDDVAEYVEKASQLGAQVIIPKSVLPDGDTMAILLDPAGLSFGICRLKLQSAPVRS
ncbi:MAG: VOC family protein [Verrucomicrobiota bacterium]